MKKYRKADEGLIILMNIVMVLAIQACGRNSVAKNIFSPFENSDTPVLFLPELALKGNTYKGSFSSDFSHFYFFRKVKPGTEEYGLYQSNYRNGKWTTPKKLLLPDEDSDTYPLVSPLHDDRIYFTSYREQKDAATGHSGTGFWIAKKKGGEWSRPEPLYFKTIDGHYNSQPCITGNGTVYFMSEPPDWSRITTFKMEYVNGRYQEPVPFDPVNSFRIADTSRRIYEVCVSPDETFMILVVATKKQKVRLFVSFRAGNNWKSPQYLGDMVNADMSGNFPYITPDGKFLVFTKEFNAFYILPVQSFQIK